ncbi:uncharacterized protein [Leuresthes tenuis]|uniref:uncharacterized protein n=1 Tax=Leuresthes tenuis TaxID=355514 RepID=UPI003B50D82C
MKTLAAFTLLAAWLSAALDVTQARAETVYFALGGELVLRPQLSVPITSITWKNKGNIVAEWIERVLPLEYYGGFKNNTVLDLITGELKISNMKKEQAGKFMVEVNNKDHDVEYDAVEIKKVSQPQVILRPLTCNKETSKVCTLSCEAEVSGAEPVTYLWKKGGGEWTEAEKDLNITNDEETQGVETFSCRLKNPVSEEESIEFKNPFYIPPFSIVVVVVVLILVLLGGAGAGAGYAYKKGKLPCFGGGKRGSSDLPPNNDDSEVKGLLGAPNSGDTAGNQAPNSGDTAGNQAPNSGDTAGNQAPNSGVTAGNQAPNS